jgi:hypothetical protein
MRRKDGSTAIRTRSLVETKGTSSENEEGKVSQVSLLYVLQYMVMPVLPINCVVPLDGRRTNIGIFVNYEKCGLYIA